MITIGCFHCEALSEYYEPAGREQMNFITRATNSVNHPYSGIRVVNLYTLIAILNKSEVQLEAALRC